MAGSGSVLCKKARNAELYAICDVAEDLRTKMEALWEPQVSYESYHAMLQDTKVDAVIIAVADEFHVPLAIQAINAGKHVLVEKPLGTSIEECEELQCLQQGTDRILQVGQKGEESSFRRAAAARPEGGLEPGPTEEQP